MSRIDVSHRELFPLVNSDLVIIWLHFFYRIIAKISDHFLLKMYIFLVTKCTEEIVLRITTMFPNNLKKKKTSIK